MHIFKHMRVPLPKDLLTSKILTQVEAWMFSMLEKYVISQPMSLSCDDIFDGTRMLLSRQPR